MANLLETVRTFLYAAFVFLLASALSVACLSVASSVAFADEMSNEGDEVTLPEDGSENGEEGDESTDPAAGPDESNKTDATDSTTTEPAFDPVPVHKPELSPDRAGWMQDSDGTWYYFNTVSDQPRIGWVLSKGKWYWLSPQDNGAMATNAFIDDKGSRYYVDAEGVMLVGWFKVGDDWYYASKSGAIQTGWLKSGNKWYWLLHDEGGRMAESQWITDKGNRYYLTNKGPGEMATGWFQDMQGDWYYANASGAQQMSGWVRSGSKWYWLLADENGKMAANKWIEDKGERYYLTDKGPGEMATGWIEQPEGWYYATKSGALQREGWIKTGGKWYWLQGDQQGLMFSSGAKQIKGQTYSFDSNGAMAADAVVDMDDNKVAYAVSTGELTPLGTRVDGELVLSDDAGDPITGWHKVAGAWFYGDEGGVAHTGWLQEGSKWYWMDANGVMAVGARTIDGKYYFFSKSGAWLPVKAEHAAVFERAVAELSKCTNDSMTKEQKLRAAFNHIRDNFTEKNPRIPHMKAFGWETIYADDIFVRGYGNCISMAAAFAFMAKAIGYDNVYACNYGHAWVEIDGRIYDPEWEKNHRSESYFNRAINAAGGPGYTNKVPVDKPWARIAI